MRSTKNLVPRGMGACATALLALSFAPTAHAAVMFSEDFDGISPAGTTLSTSNSAFNTSVSTHSDHQVTAEDDANDLFSNAAGNQYLHFEDGRTVSSSGTPRIVGALSDPVTSGLFQVSFDMHYPAIAGDDNDTRFDLLSDSNSPSSSNRVLQILFRDSLPTGPRIQVANSTSQVLLEETTYHVDIVANMGGVGTVEYIDGYSLDDRQYDVFIDGVRIREGFDLLDATTFSHFSVMSDNSSNGTTYFDNIAVVTGDDISVNLVPEPASVALVGLSILGLAAVRRRLR